MNSGRPAYEQLARALAREFDDAWDARDVARFVSFFTEDGDMNFFTLNMHMRGRDEIARTYTKIFSQLEPSVIHRSTINEIHWIADDVMLLDTTTDIMKSDASGADTVMRRHIAANIVIKKPDGWRIRALRIWSESTAAGPKREPT